MNNFCEANCHTFLVFLCNDAKLFALHVVLSSTKMIDMFVARALTDSVKLFILAFRSRLCITNCFLHSPDNVLTLDKCSLASDQNMLLSYLF